MSLTKPLNSKVNMKQISGADLPVIPRQPALARYTAESTSNQNTITFPFQIDTVNAPDSLLIMVDGKVLSYGSTFDYTFTGVDAFGFTNSVALTQNLVAGLNIQAIKLGLKKETEFVQDARFSDLYEGQDQGFQGFVRTADLMVATTSTGSPSAGQFYSSISNRAAITDLRTDLGTRMGIERQMTQDLFPIQNEAGPNGEPVFGVANDNAGRVRLMGSWAKFTQPSGNGIFSTTVGDSIEVTFYGTGINFLTFAFNASRAASITVDGVAAGTWTESTASTSLVISSRNYSTNIPINAASNLALGVHTVKLTISSNGIDIFGFEILNESSSVKVNPGSSYIAGKKMTTIAQQTVAYNSSFESGTLGTRGGRVVVYQKADGTVAKAVQPTNGSQQNLAAADHSNEELARVYSFREFGANRADDFSTLAASASDRVFTLDDGSTTLAVNQGNVTIVSAREFLNTGSSSNFWVFTFVGTGLDIFAVRNGGTGTLQLTIDGASVAGPSMSSTGVTPGLIKIVSGLPYGTHTVKILRNASNDSLQVAQFLVYQPKKPALPAGAIELADYNVMANFTNNSTQAAENLAIGILRKAAARELSYTGTFTDGITVGTGTAGAVAGYRVLGATIGNTIRYTFFGTGFDLRMSTPVAVNTFTVAIDGTNPTAAGATATGFYGQWTSFVASTGVATSNGTGQFANGLWVSGLPLGLHTITLTANGASSFGFEGIDIITPIHSHKSNLYEDLQNTLAVGSNSISDNRKTTPIKDVILQPKAWSQAIGVTSGPTTTSTSYVPMPDMSCTIKTSGGILDITGMSSIDNSANTNLQIYVDGVPVSAESALGGSASTTFLTVQALVPVAAGTHKVDIYWKTSSGTATARLLLRSLRVVER